MSDVASSAVRSAMAGWRIDRSPPTLREFCSGLLYPGGPLVGHQMDIDSDPVHAWVVDQIDSGEYSSLAWCATAQVSGKTLIGVTASSLHSAIGCGLPTGYALPTLQDLDKAWSDKLKSQFTDSGYGAALPTSGRGAKGGRGPSVQLYDPATSRAAGRLIFMAGGAYGDTCARLVVDEADQFRRRDGTPDWPAIEDLRARTGSYGSKAFTIFVGTLEINDVNKSIILQLAERQGTGTRPWMPCMDCGRFQLISGEHLIYDDTDEKSVEESARIRCRHCNADHDGDQLYDMQRRMRFVHAGQSIDESGKLVGPAPRTKQLGLIQNCYAATIADLGEVAKKRWNAQRLSDIGDVQSLRKFYWYQECQTLPDESEEGGATIVPTRNKLAAMAARSGYALSVDRRDQDGDSIHLAHMPAWAEHTTIGVDVQRGGDRAPGRLYFAALSRGDGQGAVTGWGHVIAGPVGRMPTETELHRALDRLDGLLSDWSPAATIVRIGVDVGDRGDELMRWTRSRRHWSAVMGTRPLRATRQDLDGWIYYREQTQQRRAATSRPDRIRHISTEDVCRIVHGELMAGSGRGAMALPQGLTREETLIRHFCATVEYEPGQWSTRARDRVHHPEWQYRHDLLDCVVYARALAYEWERRTTRRRAPKPGRVGDVTTRRI